MLVSIPTSFTLFPYSNSAALPSSPFLSLPCEQQEQFQMLSSPLLSLHLWTGTEAAEWTLYPEHLGSTCAQMAPGCTESISWG